jgi:hypothetical protein
MSTSTTRVTYSLCPACGRKGLYEPRDSRPGTTRCRNCKAKTSGPAKPKKQSYGYDLKKPCPKCPFRTDIKPYIRTGHAKEIVEGLSRSTFSCHETVDYDALDDLEDDEIESRNTAGEKFCAGALIMMHKQGHPGQMGRIAARLKLYDPNNLDMNAPVFHSSIAFIEAQIGGRHHPATKRGQPEHETCHCAEPGCEWPAGYMTGAGAVGGDSPPEELKTCPACGEYTCDSCFTTGGGDEAICMICAVEEDDD